MHELLTRLPLFVPGFVKLDLCIQHVSIAVKQGRSRNKKTQPSDPNCQIEIDTHPLKF
jgi:hypothetical protein